MKLALTTVAVAAALTLAVAGPAQADSCPNAQYRTGPSASLPDCRAYEQISPVDKSGNDVVAGNPMFSLGDGSRVYFGGATAIANPDAVTFDTSYVATRGADWATRGVDAPLGTSSFRQRPTLGLSDDGTKALVVSERALAPGGIEGGGNIYIRDLTQPSSYRLAVASPDPAVSRTLSDIGGMGDYTGGNGDLSAFAFSTPVPLLPGVPNDGQKYLYLWHEGRLSLAGQLPDGTPVPIDPRTATIYPPSYTTSKTQHVVSEDGTRVTFVRFGTYGLYQYREGEGTTSLAPDPSDPSMAAVTAYPIASTDGRSVVFTSNAKLDPSNPQGGLFRWTAGGVTALVSGLVQRPLAVSSDGNLVWFVQNANDPSNPDATLLRVLDVGSGVERLVARLDLESSGPLKWQISPNGRRIVFESQSPIGGIDNANPRCKGASGTLAGHCANVFGWSLDAPSKPATCISCVPAAQSIGDATIDRADTFVDGRDERVLFDDGRLFFNTPNRLAAADTNTVDDIYEYDPGTGVRLISSGTSANATRLREVSPDGRDVLFVTADRLVPQDTDDLSDAYTARVGGGIASQQVAPVTSSGCTGEGCRPGSASQPARRTPASAGTQGESRSVARRFSLARFSARTLRAAGRRGRLGVSVKVRSAGRLSATLRGRIGGRTRTAGSVKARATKAGTVRLTLHLSRAARAALRRDGRLRLRLTVRFSEVAKPTSTVLTLTTGRTASKSKGGAR